KLVVLFAALALVFAFSVPPAEATHGNVPTVVDRNAVTLMYLPEGTGAGSMFTGAVSYRYGREWDLLVSYSSDSSAHNANVLRVGGRYHLRPPTSEIDIYGTLQYRSTSSPIAANNNTGFLVGAGITQTLSPTVKAYGNWTYDSQAQLIVYDIGFQYQLSRQLGVVVGANSSALGYLGISYDLTAR